MHLTSSGGSHDLKGKVSAASTGGFYNAAVAFIALRRDRKMSVGSKQTSFSLSTCHVSYICLHSAKYFSGGLM